MSENISINTGITVNGSAADFIGQQQHHQGPSIRHVSCAYPLSVDLQHLNC